MNAFHGSAHIRHTTAIVDYHCCWYCCCRCRRRHRYSHIVTIIIIIFICSMFNFWPLDRALLEHSTASLPLNWYVLKSSSTQSISGEMRTIECAAQKSSFYLLFAKRMVTFGMHLSQVKSDCFSLTYVCGAMAFNLCKHCQ